LLDELLDLIDLITPALVFRFVDGNAILPQGEASARLVDRLLPLCRILMLAEVEHAMVEILKIHAPLPTLCVRCRSPKACARHGGSAPGSITKSMS